jgi:aminopeptidase YwaD
MSVATIVTMDGSWFKSRISAHVTALAEEIGPRPSGSPANRLATDYVRMVLAKAGLAVETQPFTCRWWEPGEAAIQIGGAWVDVPPAPFSRPCDVHGRVSRISSDAALEAASLEPGRIVVIHGALTADSYFPKAFPFLDLAEQRARIARLEALRPAAVIAAIPALRAMPVLEDGDLTFPYVAVPTPVGERLRENRAIAVRIGGALQDGEGVNVSARHGPPGPRIILSAHIDSKITTPGAFDNGGGVATLLAFAESGLSDDLPVELVFFNGEDHYLAPGEQAWLAASDLADVRQVVNIDGAGVVGHDVAVTLLASPPEHEARMRALVEGREGWVIGPEWYESDHAIFAMRGIPSLAITSSGAHETLTNVIHTDRDTPRMVDPAILADVAEFLADWLAADTST